MDAVTPGETTVDFQARDDLMVDTPVRIVRAFFESTDAGLIPVRHRDWEVNAALKSPDGRVASVMGVLHRAEDTPVPFAVFVSAK